MPFKGRKINESKSIHHAYDNKIIVPVESEEYERIASSISYQQTSTSYKSLIENFEPYTPYGVVYNPNEDEVYYNGEWVKLFVAFHPYKEGGRTYAFELLYRDKYTHSTLYLEAVRDNNSAGLTIWPLDAAIAEDLLKDSEGATAYWNDSAEKPDNGEFRYYNFDRTCGWLNLGLTATDNFSRSVLDKLVKRM